MRTVAYLGPEKTNTHLAALKQFGAKTRYVHAPTVDEVFDRVERRFADFGVVPIENSLGGAVTHTLDRYIDFVDTPVRILGEIDFPIRHYLITRKSTGLKDVEAVYSHPQAFQQCSEWLRTHLVGATQSETDSTAEAVRRLLSKKVGSWSTAWGLGKRAAIGPKDLGDAYGLKALAIPQERENRTRFLILGLETGPNLATRLKRYKTSVLLGLKDKPGALHDALVAFKGAKINLTKIESRPSKRKAWEYLFFIDFEGRECESRVKRALQSVKRSASLLRVLGSYPIGRR